MSSKGQEREKILKTLQRTTLFLSKLAHKGAASVGNDDLKALKNLIEALRYWRLKRLTKVLGKLKNSLLSGEDDERLDSGASREVSEAMTEAVFTCKAMKTYLQGRLDDDRIFEELSGRHWKDDELEVIEDLTLVQVGQELQKSDSKGKQLLSFFLDPQEKLLYKTVDSVDPLLPPKKAHMILSPKEQVLKVERALFIPDFPPQRLKLKDSHREAMTQGLSKEVLSFSTDNFKTLIRCYKGFRSNVFAPTDFYTLISYDGAYSTSKDLYLIDQDQSMLRLSLEFNDGAQARFLHHLIYGTFSCIFGKLSAKGPDTVFHPLSIFNEKERKPFLFLAKDIAP